MFVAVSYRPRFIISSVRSTFLRSVKMGHEADYPIYAEPPAAALLTGLGMREFPPYPGGSLCLRFRYALPLRPLRRIFQSQTRQWCPSLFSKSMPRSVGRDTCPAPKPTPRKGAFVCVRVPEHHNRAAILSSSTIFTHLTLAKHRRVLYFDREAVRAALGRGNPSVRLMLVDSASHSLTFGSGSLWRMSRFSGTKGHRAVTDSFQLPDHSEV